MTRTQRIREGFFMKFLPSAIALTLMFGMLAGVSFLSILPYVPK